MFRWTITAKCYVKFHVILSSVLCTNNSCNQTWVLRVINTKITNSHVTKWNVKVNVKVNMKINVKQLSFNPCYVTKLDRKWNMRWYMFKKIECILVNCCGRHLGRHLNKITVTLIMISLHVCHNTTDVKKLMEDYVRYRKVASSRLSWLVALPRIFRRLMKGKFDAYICVLWPFAKKFQNWIVDWSTARDFTVYGLL